MNIDSYSSLYQKKFNLMKFILTKPYFNSQKNCKKKNKNYLIDNVKLDGVKDKLKEAKSNKMRYLIHLKHFTVEIHCYLSHSMVKHNYRLKCSSILRDVDVNPSKFFYNFRWHHEIEKTFIPPMVDYISPNLSVDEVEYLLRI